MGSHRSHCSPFVLRVTGSVADSFRGLVLVGCALAASCLSTTGAQAQRNIGVRETHVERNEVDTVSTGSYATPALRALVFRAAIAGREVPAGLDGYQASVESEIALVLRTSAPRDGAGSAGEGVDGARERVLQVEQVKSVLSWQRNGAFDQHVTGQRTRAITSTVSALSYLRTPWVIPVLYGNRLHMLFGREAALTARDSVTVGRPSDTAGGLLAVHPFAADREAFYSFAGGDTAVTIRVGGRVIPVIRVLVAPLSGTPGSTLLFRGEIDVDAVRAQVVRMRGQFLVRRPHSLLRKVVASGWQTVAFAELVNGEFDGRFWLPSLQRIEAQARSPLAEEFRPIARIVSRFGHYKLAFSELAEFAQAQVPSPIAATLSFATRDSIGAFEDWDAEIGAAVGDARASDFNDVAPDSWRLTGPPRLDWRAQRLNDALRYNRVEGLFTGVAATMRMRDAAPGLSLGANLGWAWAERTVRGSMWSRWRRGQTVLGARAERALANSNDFRPLLDYEQSLMALLATADDYDYLDRRSATLSVSRGLHLPGGPVLRLESGLAHDGGEVARVRFGLIHLDSAFRYNRPVKAGTYWRTTLGLDVHPNVSGEFLEPGIGASLWYERGDGALRWQRIEARVAVRHTRGPLTYAGRVDGIALIAEQVLPQQLIELGENEGLPGYAYKEFGGDRAALARAAVVLQLPWQQAPLRLGSWAGPLRRTYLPGIAPSLALGFQAGWSAARSNSSRAALALFGTRTDSFSGRVLPATRPTGGVRSTVNMTLRLFGGTLGLGVAKPLDGLGRSRAWRFVFGVGQPF